MHATTTTKINKKNHIGMSKILWSVSEFSGIWRHQNKPEVGHYTEKEEEEEHTHCNSDIPITSPVLKYWRKTSWFYWFCCCWSLFYSSWADSLCSHLTLHEWIAFYSTFLNIHRSGVLTALTWLVPRETAAVSAHSVYTIQPCTMSLPAKPYT